MDDRDDTRTQENFLARWSQRKLAGEQTPSATTADAPEAGNAAPRGDPPAADPAPLPPLDSLTESSDYSGFLSPEVGEELQRLALRKLFGSARFNVRDGLDDYDEDYRFFETLGDTLTADMRQRMEREAKAVTGETVAGYEAEASDSPAPSQEAQGEAEAPEETPPHRE